MNILIVNDDGAEAAGIKYLSKILSQIGDVYVFAPAEQMSGKSHSITLRKSVYLTEFKTEDYADCKEAFKFSGTPADCAKYGIQWMTEHGAAPDIVFSGINLGSNLGHDIYYSGTAAAAAEAVLVGIPAIAVSVASHTASHFDTAATIAKELIPFAINEMEKGCMLNLNAPDLPKEEVKGIKITKIGGTSFFDQFKGTEDGGYMRAGSDVSSKNKDPETDLFAITHRYVSITPIRLDLTAHDIMKKLGTVEL